MILYFLLFYIIAIRVFTNIRKCRNSMFELVLMMLGIFIVIAFRDENSGTDTWNYLASFIRVKSYSLPELLQVSTQADSQEFGFLLFEWIIGKVIPNSNQSLFIFQALIVSISYGFFIYKYCNKNYFLAVLGFMTFGLFGFHITGVRQSLAMSFCVWAYVMYDKKRYILGTLIVLFACTFHMSAIVSILYLLYGKIWKIGNSIWTAMVVGVSIASASGMILEKVSILTERWNSYSTIESTGNGQIFMLILLIIALIGETLDRKNVEYQYAKRINYLSMIFWMGRLVTRTMHRPAMYFFSANLQIMVNGIEDYRHKESRQLLKIGAFICISLYYIYRFSGYNYHLISIF